MHRLDAFLTTFERRCANTLVTFGIAALHEGDSQVMVSLSRFEFDLPQPSVDFCDRHIEPRVDCLVIAFAADVGAIELFSVEQRQHGVFELHLRHFSRQRHVADREFVFAIRREPVLDGHAAPRSERHPFDVMLLPARAGSGLGIERNHHVLDVAVSGRHRRRLDVAHGLLRDLARGRNVLVYEVGRNLQVGCIVIEMPLDVIQRQQLRYIHRDTEQIANDVGVFAAVQAMQCHTAGWRMSGTVDFGFEPRDQLRHGLFIRPLGSTHRRHQPPAQLADHGLPDLRILGNMVWG